ncbi:DUF4326 domain-containing protein [Methylorubrum rhodesianum]|uniref:DUF4326 domain-containing protein n=1 Tax=Methylorubrum rhodesianum TaxID=29427 RepID=UPI003D079B1C
MTLASETRAPVGARPVRLQLSRKKGFDLQAHSRALNGLPAVKVDRSTRFGNPCTCQAPYGCPHSEEFERDAWADDNGEISPLLCCVAVFRHYVETGLRGEGTSTGRLRFMLEGAAGYPRRAKLVAGLPSLRGKNLACWCALCPEHAAGKPFGIHCCDCSPCHADVLGGLANG